MVLLEDALDGGVAEGTVTFSLAGVSYELDLSEANAAKLRDVLGAPTSGPGGGSEAVRAS